ncbi:MAG: radical SAM protein [Spirochaetales bacterium]|nr:radical SAM protein [Spirochaetales bacterium]
MIDKTILFDYIDNGIIPEGPLTVHIDIIEACNLDCITCWKHSPLLPGNREKKSFRTLVFSDFMRIIGDLKSIGVEKLIISGSGEPFLHADCYRMIEAAKKALFHVTVLTNATLIDRKRINDAPPDKLLVNIGAATETTYRSLHPGSSVDFDRLLSNLQRLNEYINITLVMVVSKLNYTELLPLAELARSFKKATLSFKKAGTVEATAHLGINGEETDRILGRLDDIEEICGRFRIPHNLGMFRNQLQSIGTAGAFRDTGCYAGLFYSRIYLDGNVYFCCARIPVGNVFEAPFSTLWNGTSYRRIRDKLAGGSYFPECDHCGKYNLNYSASMLIRERLL